MQITIKGKEYNVKYTIRALFIFEQITGKHFMIETLLDNYVFFYSMILANNSNSDSILTFDEFLDAIDEDKELVNQLSQIVNDYQTKDNLFENEEKNTDDSKKN